MLWQIISAGLISRKADPMLLTYLLGASSLAEVYAAIAARDPMYIFPILFVVLILLGWAASELSVEKDPIRSHQRHKSQQKSHTMIRL